MSSRPRSRTFRLAAVSTLAALLLVDVAASSSGADPASGSNDRTVAKRATAGGMVPLTPPSGCLEALDLRAECGALGPVNIPEDMEFTPDGRTAYLASQSSSTVTVYRRNVRTGALRLIQCFASGIRAGCEGTARAINQPTGLAVSPDGEQLYVAAVASGGLARFDIAADGRLTQPAAGAGCYTATGADECTAVRATGGAFGVAMSPDGTSVYVAASSANALAVFVADAAGNLTQPGGAAGCYNVSGADDCAVYGRLTGATEVAMVGNGHVVVAALTDDSVSAFPRDPATGALDVPSTDACIDTDGEGGCVTNIGMDGVRQLAVAGRVVHVAASVRSQVSAIRVAADGSLDLFACRNATGTDGCSGEARWSAGVTGVAARGNRTYVLNQPNGLLVAFDLTGLAYVPRPGRAGCLRSDALSALAGCTATPGLRGPWNLAISPDGTTLYSFGPGTSADSFNASLNVVRLDRAPSCKAVRATSRDDKAVSVRLRCTDPDGDALRLAIVEGPKRAQGTLGPVNQAKDTVRFAPKRSFEGRATFTYRATSRQVPSAVAKVTVRVR